MALTRAQLLMGNQNQGAVLTGQVQGVKQGTGVEITPDGTINFDPNTATGVVRTNNTEAFNGYFWPSNGDAPGDLATFLCTDASGNLSWEPPSFGSVVSVGLQPSPSRVGRLWFDQNTRTLKIYENISSIGQWTPVSQGNPVEPASVSASPSFVSGDGSEASPYVLDTITASTGSYAKASNVVTISGLAPYQYVSIVDLNQVANGFRFSPTTTFADETGVLKFMVAFEDYPATPPGQSLNALFKVGFESCYISVEATTAAALVLDDAGSISGTPKVGETLTYTQGSASGGISPYTYTWVWKRQSDGLVLQTNGSILTVPSSVVDDRVFVQLTATDSHLQSVSGSTAGYPLSPAVIGKEAFPNTVIAFPTTIPGEAVTTWIDADTTLSSSSCIEFKVNAGSYSQGPTAITNGDTITTQWVTSPLCNGAASGTTISGCVFDTSYEECGSLTIDRIPSPFTFSPVSGIVAGNTGTSQIIVPMGFNSTAYVSYSGTSTATTIEASVNGGAFAALPTFGSNTFAINPGESLQIRATTGATPSSAYTANINIGQGTSVQSTTFTLNTSAASNFVTPIDFPVITTGNSSAVTWLAGDGSTTLTSTDCIEFKVNAGAFSQGPTAITTGDTITTRWASGGSCGGAAHGTTITGTVTDGSSTNYASLTIDRVPASFTFTSLTNQTISTLVTSNTLNIIGFNAPAYITYSAPPSGSSLTTVEASVAGGPWTAIPSSGTTLPINPVASGPGNTLQIRGITGPALSTSYGVQINAGESTSIQTSVWTATTSSAIPGIVMPSILTPVNGATNLTPFSSSPAGITITSSTYTAINGAGTHASTDWEIRSGSTSGTVIFNGNSLTELTSYFLDEALINPSTSYFVRCRYYSNDLVPVVSSWSAWSQFSTAAAFGLTWVQRTSGGSSNNLLAVTYIGATTNKFVAVGESGACRKSSDGISWSNSSFGALNLRAITPGYGAYANTLVVVGNNGSLWSSVDGGSNWTLLSPDLNSSKDFETVTCNPSGRFVAAGQDGVMRTTTSLGPIWTTVSSGTSSDISCLIWDSTNSRFIGTSVDNRILTSASGTSWTASSPITLSPNFTFGQILIIPGSPDRYLLLPLRGTADPYYAISTNLSSWTVYTISSPVNAGVAGSGFVALGGSANVSASNQLFSSVLSLNPLSFVSDVTIPSGRGIYCMAYSSGLNRYVAIGKTAAIYSTS